MAWYKVIEDIPAGTTVWWDESRREVRCLKVDDCRQGLRLNGSKAFKTKLCRGDKVNENGWVMRSGEPFYTIESMFDNSGVIQYYEKPAPICDRRFYLSGKSYDDWCRKQGIEVPPSSPFKPTEPYAVALKLTTYTLREDAAIGSLVVCIFSSAGLYAELWDGKPRNGLLCQAREDFKAGELVYPDQHGILCRVSQPVRPVDQPKYGESAMTSEAINGGPPKPKLEWRVTAGNWAGEGLALEVSLVVDGKDFKSGYVKRPPAGELSARQSRKLERKIEEVKAGIMRTYLLTVRQSGPANRTV